MIYNSIPLWPRIDLPECSMEAWERMDILLLLHAVVGCNSV